jgi:glycosyltransferase involved in cell wall biosynthesis
MKSLEDKDVVFISVDPWQEDRWARKQMFAWLLSGKFRNVVYYVEPGRSPRKLPLLKRLKKNLFLVDVPFIPNFLHFIFFPRLRVQISCFLLWIALKYLRVNKPIFIIYQPHNLAFAKKLTSMFGKSLVCYDLTDDWSEFFNTFESWKQQFIESENLVIKQADIILAVSEKLFHKARSINSNTYYLPNATNFNNFNRVAQNIEIAPQILRIPGPRIGYVGKITPWRIDFDLIKFVAKSKPDWSIIMIGPIHPEAKDLVNDLSKSENIFILGPKNYYSLPEYMKGFDCCIIPHLIDPLTESMDPIKLYDYMATGKPVVATALTEANKFKDFIKIGNSYEEFLSFLIESVKQKPSEETIGRQLETARENSWENRADQLTKILEDNIYPAPIKIKEVQEVIDQ